eukprot:scaffold81898_cov18-Tisochrysis_lutea.AAC.1
MQAHRLQHSCGSRAYFRGACSRRGLKLRASGNNDPLEYGASRPSKGHPHTSLMRDKDIHFTGRKYEKACTTSLLILIATILVTSVRASGHSTGLNAEPLSTSRLLLTIIMPHPLLESIAPQTVMAFAALMVCIGLPTCMLLMIGLPTCVLIRA